ncbi:predicted protein [Plenodomus lingam JN3]|uniref:Predicted protein n=1 Tax=Leptosphaeria maculans (strain JN3 / isolate v23.1.3 / race Av1-4-5-6-7-8) TaxID=985895 RepID=E4ZP99_LEPMJ|nr:predicted protein [Plenodomus lingam JN3]CBX93124.1 predicted protein [Plenodomus lingam JN3]
MAWGLWTRPIRQFRQDKTTKLPRWENGRMEYMLHPTTPRYSSTGACLQDTQLHRQTPCRSILIPPWPADVALPYLHR